MVVVLKDGLQFYLKKYCRFVLPLLILLGLKIITANKREKEIF
jgi:hypothetical protein